MMDTSHDNEINALEVQMNEIIKENKETPAPAATPTPTNNNNDEQQNNDSMLMQSDDIDDKQQQQQQDNTIDNQEQQKSTETNNNELTSKQETISSNLTTNEEKLQQTAAKTCENIFDLLKQVSDNTEKKQQINEKTSATNTTPTTSTATTTTTTSTGGGFKRNVAVKNSQAKLPQLIASTNIIVPRTEHIVIDDEANDILHLETDKSVENFARKSTSSMSSILSAQNQTKLNQRSSTTTTPNLTTVKPTAIKSSTNENSITSTAHYLQQQKYSANISKIKSGPVTRTTSTQLNEELETKTTEKQFKNKIVFCKPYYQSKATECQPSVKHVSTQIDLDEIKPSHTVVPLPVPINVPLPMCMYQAPMPVPVVIPIPIPIPVFIPTTKRTFDRVERRIRRLRKKLPSDPSEFQILLYAEQLAREEGIPGFEDSSDGESDPETTEKKVKKSINKDDTQNQPTISLPDQEGSFKWSYGLRVFNTYLTKRNDEQNDASKLPNDLLKLTNDELNSVLAEFVHNVRKPNDDPYAPESVYYLLLGIQHALQESGRVENIFLDGIFDKFQESFNSIAVKFQIRLTIDGQVMSRVEEEILWESRQLGAHSPFVLLNTILFFNTKYFFLDKAESHLQLSFTNVKKHSKRNIGPNGEDFGKTLYLRYYPDFQGLEQVIYEQSENFENPLRCPVKLYEFYLSKCPENVKNRSDVFYLLPEKACIPNSPVWFSSQPLGVKTLERMLNRIKMVKEVNELLLAASASSTGNQITTV